MTEFNDRNAIQRQIIQFINAKFALKEELCSLSGNAIERWLSANQIAKDSAIARLLFETSSKLFFLAANSQEKISERYKLLTSEIDALMRRIERACEG